MMKRAGRIPPERCDGALNMARSYTLTVSPTLFPAEETKRPLRTDIFDDRSEIRFCVLSDARSVNSSAARVH
jgi:hypothetical protein